jgi:hypothetical protein
MITRAITAGRQDLILRELIERAELREMCLQVLQARSGGDPGLAVAAVGERFAEALDSAPLNPGRADTQTALPAPATIRRGP